MFLRTVFLLITALLLTACWPQKESESSRLVIEQREEIKRLKQDLINAYRLISSTEQDGTLVRYRTIKTTAKIAGGGSTLDLIRERKKLLCGGNADLPGFGYLEPDTSEFSGFDIDICRAIGAAVLGSNGASLVEIVPLNSKLRFSSLQSGEIDLLSRNTTWTLSRDVELGIDFVATTFYDGQHVMVRKNDGILKISDLANRTICVQAGSTSEANINDYFKSSGLPVEILAFDERRTARTQYDVGACEAYTGDKSSLISQRTLLEDPDSHEILIHEISREPLSIAVRQNDGNWADVVRWTLQCLIAAESLGISQSNVQQQLKSETVLIRNLLGQSGSLGQKLGLSDDFCYEVILQVGSYKDIYSRNLGASSEFNLQRGLNALYREGGLLYPIPFK